MRHEQAGAVRGSARQRVRADRGQALDTRKRQGVLTDVWLAISGARVEKDCKEGKVVVQRRMTDLGAEGRRVSRVPAACEPRTGSASLRPDLTTLGKIIGGGMPVGAYGGKKEIMDFVSPQGPVYQAGTLSGNPIAMAAGWAMLNYLNSHPETYEALESITAQIVEGIRDNLKKLGLDYTLNAVGSMFSIFFTNSAVHDFETAKLSNTRLFSQYFRSMLEQGVYLAPSQFETLFVSTALSEEDIAHIIKANYQALKLVSQSH